MLLLSLRAWKVIRTLHYNTLILVKIKIEINQTTKRQEKATYGIHSKLCKCEYLHEFPFRNLIRIQVEPKTIQNPEENIKREISTANDKIKNSNTLYE